MKNCSCGNGSVSKEHNILIKVKAHFVRGAVVSDCFCAQCGKRSSVILGENDVVIDIEHFNIPAKAIVSEFQLVKNIFVKNCYTLDILLIYNILYAIAWAYEVDYYQKFASYAFGDVRNAIVDFVIEHKDELNYSSPYFFDDNTSYDEYISAILCILKSQKCEEICFIRTLEMRYDSGNIAAYGPIASIFNSYIDNNGNYHPSNNHYYKDDKYFIENRASLQQEANELHSEIVALICAHLHACCPHLNFMHSKLSLDELRKILVNSNYGKDKIILTGVLGTFEKVLGCDVYRELTLRTYKENLEMLKNALAFVQEHI